MKSTPVAKPFLSPLLFSALFFSSLLHSAQSFAQGSSGPNGGSGAAMVCTNPVTHEVTASLLDLYAAEHDEESPLHIVRSNRPMKDQIKDAYKKLAPNLQKEMLLTMQKTTIVPLAEDVTLKKPYDMGRKPIPVKDGCTVEWVAYMDDVEGTLQIVTKYFKLMSPTDQAALFLHEPIYHLKRLATQDEDSSSTRELVPYLFTDDSDADEEINELTQNIRHPQSRIIEVGPDAEQITLKIAQGPFSNGYAVQCRDQNFNKIEEQENWTKDNAYNPVKSGQATVTAKCEYLLFIMLWGDDNVSTEILVDDHPIRTILNNFRPVSSYDRFNDKGSTRFFTVMHKGAYTKIGETEAAAVKRWLRK